MELVRELWALFRDRATRNGARESGLTGTADLNVVNAGLDTLIAVALAGHLFFAAPTSQARDHVALYLLTTMAPFAVLAPVIGPLLDRVGRRRLALSGTLLARAVLAWLLAGHGGLALYPIALGLLVFSKGFGVAKSAIVPRIVPPGATLVVVNSRLQFASLLGSLLAAPAGAGVDRLLGYRVLLKLAAAGYLLAVLAVYRLPSRVDSPAGSPARRVTALPGAVLGAGRLGRTLGNLPAALRGLLPVRALVGFLTVFLAFYLRTSGHGTGALALLAGASAAGSLAGLWLGRAAGRLRPEGLITGGALLSLLGSVAAAAFFSFPAALGLAGLVTLASVMAKLALDAVIQRDVAEEVRASVFGRSETAVQLAWVAGGAAGLIPLPGRVGFIVASVAMGLAVTITTLGLGRGDRGPRGSRQPGRGPRRPAPATGVGLPPAR